MQNKTLLNILADTHKRNIKELLSYHLEIDHRITNTFKPNGKLLQILNDVKLQRKLLNYYWRNK